MAPRLARGAGARPPRARAGGAALACAGAALWTIWGPRAPGAAQVPSELLRQESGQPAAGGCDAALNDGFEVFRDEHAAWATSASSVRLVKNFGQASAAVEQRALAAFDAAGAAGDCSRQRATLSEGMRKVIWEMYRIMRSIAEKEEAVALEERLLAGMRKRGGPLRVQEKIDMLQKAVAAYKVKARELTPAWAAEQAASEDAAAEGRLGELQFGIEETAGGQYLARVWQLKREKSVMNERAHGVSLSVDPALRVLLRPEGLGNVQIYSAGPAGPPDNPLSVNVGIINDASMADVYREHPVPPLIAAQPAVRLNVNVR